MGESQEGGILWETRGLKDVGDGFTDRVSAYVIGMRELQEKIESSGITVAIPPFVFIDSYCVSLVGGIILISNRTDHSLTPLLRIDCNGSEYIVEGTNLQFSVEMAGMVIERAGKEVVSSVVRGLRDGSDQKVVNLIGELEVLLEQL